MADQARRHDDAVAIALYPLLYEEMARLAGFLETHFPHAREYHRTVDAAITLLRDAYGLPTPPKGPLSAYY